MTQVNIQTLKSDYPDEFRKQYDAWYPTAVDDYTWWDCTYDDFIARVEPLGVEVGRAKGNRPQIWFSLGYSQSDYAAFEGRVALGTWLESQGYGLTHLPLVLDMNEHGARAIVGTRGRSGTSYVSDIDYNPGQCYPSGVFSELPQAEWDDMVCAQFESEDWEAMLNDWLQEQCSELYDALVGEYEHLTSEESFVEAMCDELFDVEVDDEVSCED